MKKDTPDLDRILDQALTDIGNERLDAHTEKAVADRVRERLAPEIARLAAEAEEVPQQIRDCSDFQALIPAYLRDGLNEAKAMLLEDHLGHCVPCRRALKQARAGHRARTASSDSAGSGRSNLGWRIAAAAVIFLAFIGLSIQTDVFSIEAGGMIRVESIDGEAYRVSDEGTVPVKAGDTIEFQDVSGIRTGRGSNAVIRLEDDSLVEMNERSELAVYDRHKLWNRGNGDAVIDLARGSIIVEASKQGSGHLFVDTQDANVAVTGTVFAVNRGVKGSRVSVVEGEVHVRHGGDEEILLAGQQSTTQALTRTPVENEISWSRNRERHLRVLAELARIADEIDDRLDGPGHRYSTDLLDLAPENTVVYIGIPNMSDTVTRSYDLLQEKIAGNELLEQWWAESVVDTGAEDGLREAMDKIRAYGGHLGDEIVIALPLAAGSGRDVDAPIILAELARPEGFRDLVASEIVEIEAGTGEVGLQLLDEGWIGGPSSGATDGHKDVYVWTGGDHVAVSPALEPIRRFAATRATGQKSSFTAQPFHRRLSDLYGDGVEWVVGIDVATLLTQTDDHQGASERDALEEMGLRDLQHIIGERKEIDEFTENRVALTFDQPRRGLASWLAEPGPIGSLDFISEDAGLAAAFVMKEPSLAVEELFSILRSADSNFDRNLEEFERESGIDIRRDIAEPLGGDFTIALDGPILPNPSWKLILEVYKPEQLQATLEWAVGELTEAAAKIGSRGVAIESEESGGRVYYRIVSLDTGLAAHYTFVDGYLLAGASKALLDRAMQYRDSGLTLANSRRFLDLMPSDSQVNFSGAIYYNARSLLGRFTDTVSGAIQGLSSEHREALSQLGVTVEPSLTLAYGENSRILFVNRTSAGLFGSSVGAFLRLDALMTVQELLGHAAGEEVGIDPDPAPRDLDDRMEDPARSG